MKTGGLILTLLLATAATAAEDTYPPGTSRHEIEGLHTTLVIPADYVAKREYSLLVTLHGMGGTGDQMARGFGSLSRDGFVVCAPKSRGQGWTSRDIGDVRKIVAGLRKKLSIGKGRLHANGYSNGGFNLGKLVFDKALPFTSAAYIGAGYQGEAVDPGDRTGLGVIVLLGGQDPYAEQAKQTVELLRDKVRSVECHVQPGVGHTYPPRLAAYYVRWMKAMEGRLPPGDDVALEWGSDLAAAKAEMAKAKRAGLIYVYSAADAGTDADRKLRREVLLDPLVRHFAGQLTRVKLDLKESAALVAAMRIRKTPALVLLRANGRVSKRFEAKFDVTKLASALRRVAPKRKEPAELGVFVLGK